MGDGTLETNLQLDPGRPHPQKWNWRRPTLLGSNGGRQRAAIHAVELHGGNLGKRTLGVWTTAASLSPPGLSSVGTIIALFSSFLLNLCCGSSSVSCSILNLINDYCMLSFFTKLALSFHGTKFKTFLSFLESLIMGKCLENYWLLKNQKECRVRLGPWDLTSHPLPPWLTRMVAVMLARPCGQLGGGGSLPPTEAPVPSWMEGTNTCSHVTGGAQWPWWTWQMFWGINDNRNTGDDVHQQQNEQIGGVTHRGPPTWRRPEGDIHKSQKKWHVLFSRKFNSIQGCANTKGSIQTQQG